MLNLKKLICDKKKILVVKYLEIFILNFEISKNHYLKCLRTQYVKANYLNTYPLPYPKKKKNFR